MLGGGGIYPNQKSKHNYNIHTPVTMCVCVCVCVCVWMCVIDFFVCLRGDMLNSMVQKKLDSHYVKYINFFGILYLVHCWYRLQHGHYILFISLYKEIIYFVFIIYTFCEIKCFKLLYSKIFNNCSFLDLSKAFDYILRYIVVNVPHWLMHFTNRKVLGSWVESEVAGFFVFSHMQRSKLDTDDGLF